MQPSNLYQAIHYVGGICTDNNQCCVRLGGRDPMECIHIYTYIYIYMHVIYIYNRSVCLNVCLSVCCLSVHDVCSGERGLPREMNRVDRKGGGGEGGYL